MGMYGHEFVVEGSKKYRAPYGAFVPHPKVTSDPVGDSRTRQEFAEECDINEIMSRYEATGIMPEYGRVQPQYLDCVDIPDFQQAMDYMIEAQASFNRLPAQVRREFDNDPRKFVDFAMKEDNLPKMREWGLTAPEEAPVAPMKVEVVNSPPLDGEPLGEPLKAAKTPKGS